MEWPNKNQGGEADERPARGAEFLTNAKREHQELFATFIGKAEDYVSVDEYTDGLESAAWKLTEAIAKASYKNGVSRGRGYTGRRGR